MNDASVASVSLQRLDTTSERRPGYKWPRKLDMVASSYLFGSFLLESQADSIHYQSDGLNLAFNTVGDCGGFVVGFFFFFFNQYFLARLFFFFFFFFCCATQHVGV